MEKMLDSIKYKYRQRRVSREKQWPPCHLSKLITLILVEGSKEDGYIAHHISGKQRKLNRTPLNYSDLFKMDSSGKEVKKVLVEGDAGIGKTTLCISISEDWANNKLFQEFKLVLYLPLRHKRVSSASSLQELLEMLHRDKAVCNSVADILLEEEGANTLIIADGWDECSDKSNQSFLFSLLFEDNLPFASVIVTSRPTASSKFHTQSCIDRFVEINGFNRDSINEYIECEFSKDLEQSNLLKEQVDLNPIIESICSVPLNCAIICHLWHHSKGSLPTTMTELYTKIVCSVVLRNIQKNGYEDFLQLSNLKRLPKQLKRPLQHLCKFAYQTLKNDQLIFSQDELLAEGLDLDKSILCFGLLQSSMSALEDGFGVSFHFIHKIFQEYLAAIYLVENLEYLSQEITLHADSSFFDIVWRFIFGIFFNLGNEYHHFDVIEQYLSNFDVDETLALCHCAFEAKNEVVDQIIIKLISKNKIIEFYNDSAYDCHAMIYVLEQMHQSKECAIYLKKCGTAVEYQIQKLKEVLVSKTGKVQIKEMNLKGNQLNHRCILNFFDGAECAFQSIKRLYLSSNRIGTADSTQFTFQNFLFRSLSLLDLSDNPLEMLGFQALEIALKSDSLTDLRKLLLRNTLTSDAKSNSTILNTFVKALSLHCPNLKRLNLSQNNLGIPGAEVLATNMSQHDKDSATCQQGWLSELVLNETQLGDEGLCRFIQGLENQFDFNILYLRGNDIHVRGIQCLVDALCKEKIFFEPMAHRVELWLDDNPLGLEGAYCIGQLLSTPEVTCQAIGMVRCQLTTAYDSTDDTAEQVGQQLCELQPNQDMQSLYLDGNNFTGKGIYILAGLIYLCPNLQNLRSGNCAISSDDFKELLSRINTFKLSSSDFCSMLHAWHLDDNKIDDTGLIALNDIQPWLLFPRIKCATKRNPYIMMNLNLFNTRVSTEAVRILNEKWKEELKINDIDDTLSFDESESDSESEECSSHSSDSTNESDCGSSESEVESSGEDTDSEDHNEGGAEKDEIEELCEDLEDYNEDGAEKDEIEQLCEDTPKIEMDSEAANIFREDEVVCKFELKSGNIINPDCLFKNLAIDICEKYIEIGIELKLDYKVLINELETGEFRTQKGSRKALRMLQLWKDSVDEDGCTYSVLASALENNGFRRSAVKYCYTSTADKYTRKRAHDESYNLESCQLEKRPHL